MTRDPMSPPQRSASLRLRQWVKHNLFDGWFNSGLTLALAIVLIWAVTALLGWILGTANWAVVTENLRLFLVGRYPVEQTWRLWTVGAIALMPIFLWSPAGRGRLRPLRGISLAIAGGMSLWLIAGGLRLPPVSTNLWGGLLLTLVVALSSTVLAFPLGVLLALGRQSLLPILRGFCTTYIELIRGLPLIGILFMAQVMLPLVLPGQPNIDRIVRAIAGLVLFNAAYLAESVRGGLQSIPRGQTEAAKALGFNVPLTLWLIILPQALRIASAAIVGQFISLFKDTSLLALFSLLELTGIARSVLAQPEFLGNYAEVYLWIGLIYWSLCYALSKISQRLESRRRPVR